MVFINPMQMIALTCPDLARLLVNKSGVTASSLQCSIGPSGDQITHFSHLSPLQVGSGLQSTHGSCNLHPKGEVGH